MRNRWIALLALNLGICIFATACGEKKSSEGKSKAAPDKSKGRVAVYMYSEYIDEAMLDEFKERTGLEVKLDVYEATEEMMAKLQTAGGDSQYDVVVVSDHAIPTLAKLGLLQKLNAEQIPNKKNVDGKFLNPPYDPANEFSLPYQWGTMGIMYRKDKIGELGPDRASWSLFFDPSRQPGTFMLIDSIRDMMGAALKFQGRSINSRNPEELKLAGDLILSAKQSEKCLGFEGGVGGKNKILSGDCDLAIVYNGDAVRGIAEDPNAAFVLPAEGTLIWMDAMTIPSKAPNSEGAHQFINYILDAQPGATLSDYNQYATPNAASVPLINEDDRNNSAIYPSDEQIAKMEYLEDVGGDTKLYDEIWTSVKSR